MSELAIAVTIGVAFGFALERAGLGDARKLASQFYLTDLTVFKVMFAAIVTAMLGVYWLRWFGVIDLARIFVPETFLLPQLVGGLLFGAGFVLAGLCPGTSCVAAATGRGDGLFVMLGMFGGVLVTGLSFEPMRAFYESTGRGALALPSLLQLSYGVVVCAVVLIALIAFRVAEWVEAPHPGPLPATGRERKHTVLAGIAIAAGLLAMAPGPASDASRLASIIAREEDHVTALELARWIRDRKPGLRILDLRAAEEFETLRVPRSERMPIETLVKMSFDPTETLVLISDGGAHAAQAWVLLQSLGYRQVYFLRGGMGEWIAEVISPANPSELTRYFGGMPRTEAEAADANAIRRRGC